MLTTKQLWNCTVILPERTNKRLACCRYSTDQMMTDSITVTLPWPDRALWQNSRAHWTIARSATRALRQRAHWEMQWAGSRYLTITSRPVLTWTIQPPDKRRRDMPNVIGALKPAIDGIQDALGIDDQHFLHQWPQEFGEPVTGGKITVTISNGG